MASSKLVTTNTDLPRDSSSSSSSSSSTLLSSSSHHLLHSNSMDDLLNSIYNTPHPSSSSSPPPPPPSSKTVDDVWKDMILTHSHSHTDSGEPLEEITLEAFLTKAGAVRDEDVTGVSPPPPAPPPHHHHHHHQHPLPQFPVAVEGSSSSSVVEPFANGIEGAVVGVPPSSSSGAGAGGAKGKRRAVEEPVDKATLQKQRRMIKNRESAARSRERKQAYTTELESLVQQLEIENARLLNEEADKKRQRLKELIEFVIPVVEKRKPRRLPRTSSVQSL